MTGDELKRHMHTVLPLEVIEQLAKDYNVVERERQLDVVQLIVTSSCAEVPRG